MEENATDAYSQEQLMLVEELRDKVRKCLSPEDPRRSSVLSEVSPARSSRGGRRRKHRSEDAQKVPAADRGYTARASETRPAQFSRVLTDGSPRLVRAIWDLNETEIASIVAHYSPSDEQRKICAWRLATRLSQRHKKPETRHQARIIAWVILRGGGVADCRTFLGIPADTWHNSYPRRIANKLTVSLERLDINSLLAWHALWSVPAERRNTG